MPTGIQERPELPVLQAVQDQLARQVRPALPAQQDQMGPRARRVQPAQRVLLATLAIPVRQGQRALPEPQVLREPLEQLVRLALWETRGQLALPVLPA